MGKARMSMLDLRVQARELNRRLAGSRVANVYDINSKTYLLKLAVPPAWNEVGRDNESSWQKVQLLVESGARIHTTNFVREKGDVPSPFTIKLRKHIRMRRLESIEQVGADRVMNLSFSAAGKVAFHLVLEFYAGGNIVLTDNEFSILAVLRVYKGPAASGPVAVKEKYIVEAARADPAITTADLQNAIDAANDKDTAKKAFSTALSIGPELVEHAVLRAGFDSVVTKISTIRKSPGAANRMMDALDPFLRVLRNEEVPELHVRGLVVIVPSGVEDPAAVPQYEAYSPYPMAQFESRKTKEYDVFDDAVDEYFARSESHRSESQLKKKEDAVLKKMEKVKNQLQSQVTELEVAQEDSKRKAQAIEFNLADVEAAIMVMRGTVASGLDWEELDESIKTERDNGNPVAQIIHSLHLEKNSVTLMLAPDEDYDFGDAEDEARYDDDDDDDDNETFEPAPSQAALLVDVDIFVSAHANAKRYYDNKRVAASKHDKALTATAKAIESAELKAKKDLEKVETSHASVREARKRYWFEKFHWFISSENFLVVAGRDAQQNEILVRRYLKKEDAYVHADIHGASSVVVKNTLQNKDKDVPHLTLTQAGCFAMCRSSAWDSKIVTSAWWVRASQVSKTAPSGEYLSTGSFVIRGKKNFLPPSPLVMGFGLLFRIDETCAVNHVGERVIKTQDDEQSESNIPAKDIDATMLDISDEIDIVGGQEPQQEGDKPALLTDDLKLERTEEDVGEERIEEGRSMPIAKATLQDISIQKDANLFLQYESSLMEGSVEGTADKYGLDQQAPEVGTDDIQQDNEPARTKKYISARERKMLKKTGRGDPAQNDEKKVEVRVPSQGKQAAPTPLPRGKKGKLKKMKARYTDQDEDERILALKLLGATTMKEMDQRADYERDGMKEVMEESVASQSESRQKDRLPWNKREQRREDKEVRQLMEEEGIVELTDAEKDALTSLDLLTGRPLANDIINFAVPMCAPYSAMNTVKFKVKLLPGILRRGKAYRQAESVFQMNIDREFANHPASLAHVRDLLRAIPEADALQTIVSNSRVSAPGLEDAKKSAKKSKGGR